MSNKAKLPAPNMRAVMLRACGAGVSRHQLYGVTTEPPEYLGVVQQPATPGPDIEPHALQGAAVVDERVELRSRHGLDCLGDITLFTQDNLDVSSPLERRQSGGVHTEEVRALQRLDHP